MNNFSQLAYFRNGRSSLFVVTTVVFFSAIGNSTAHRALAQMSQRVPIEVSQAVEDALSDGRSLQQNEPNPLNLFGPSLSNQAPTRATPDNATTESDNEQDFSAGLTPPASSNARGGFTSTLDPQQTSANSSCRRFPPVTNAPVPINVPVHESYEVISGLPSEEPISSSNTNVDGCAPADTIGPMSPRRIQGFHCIGDACEGPQPGRNAGTETGPIPWQAFAQGDYVGPARTPQLSEYRLRTDDLIEFVFRITTDATADHYRVQVGDILRIESLEAPEHNRDELIVQPDGYVSMAIVGEVRAADRTLFEISEEVNQRFVKDIKNPRVTVSAVRVNTAVEELRNTVDNRYGAGGQSRRSRVSPAGTVQLPAIGSIPAQGLTLTELKREIEAAYDLIVTGMEVTPILERRAPRFIYVLGEVRRPGRFKLQGPTTAIQAVALAEGWNPGANLRQAIIVRRDNNWNLMAAKVDIHDALHAKDPCPAGEVWLRDSDIVLVPKRPIQVIDDVIDLVFTRGIDGVVPVFFADTLTTL